MLGEAVWIQKQTPILIELSPRFGRYRLWDVSHTIPYPQHGVLDAEIRIEGIWERMYFNKNWGRHHDPRELGTWLKQKCSPRYTASPGVAVLEVRYLTARSSG